MKSFKVVSPVNNKVYAERAYASVKEIDQVLKLANSAQKSWKQVSLSDRAEICQRMLDEFVNQKFLKDSSYKLLIKIFILSR